MRDADLILLAEREQADLKDSDPATAAIIRLLCDALRRKEPPVIITIPGGPVSAQPAFMDRIRQTIADYELRRGR